MKQSFWHELSRPFLVQAPMEQVTDVVFREMIARVGRPDVFYTEFTNIDGLLSEGAEAVKRRLDFLPSQRPIVAQIWGTNPEHYFKVAQLIGKLGFDGVDINMGCPDRTIVAKGSCGGLIRNPSLAKDIIQATTEGAGALPVSVKTRLGYSQIQTEEWLGFLLEQKPVVLTVHGRTVKEMSKVPAHWDEIGKAVHLRNQISPETLVVGNGDVESREEAADKARAYGVDGVMIGRGIFHNIGVFRADQQGKDLSCEERITLLIAHLQLYDQAWHGKKPFEIMKKFYKVYIASFPGASELRAELMGLKDAEETIAFLKLQLTDTQSSYDQTA